MLKKAKNSAKRGLAGSKQTFMDLHQPAAPSIQDVVKQGYLMKEGGSYKSWKSRFFVVDGHTRTMYYYAKPKDKRPLGFIPLWDCKVEPNVDREYQNCFEVVHPDRRTFYMVTASPKELNEWVEALREVVRAGIKARKSKVNSFWQRAFGDETSVKWPVFRDALKEHLTDDFDVSTEDRIHFVLATLALKSQPKDEVHLGQVHLYTELLGPLQSSYKNLHEICLWYHGALTSLDAENKLANQPEGTFLLRLRRFAADSGLLALSVVSKKGITHTNLYKEPITDLYYTGYHDPVFATVQELVHAHPLCSKPCETSVAREFSLQFEAARLAEGAKRQTADSIVDDEAVKPASSWTSVPVSTPGRHAAVTALAASAEDPMPFSPREPMMMPGSDESIILDAGDHNGAPGTRQAPAAAAAVLSPTPASVDVLPSSAVIKSPDGVPVVAAVSGVTTFDAMHQPPARGVRDVLKQGWLTRISDDEPPLPNYFILSGALKTLYYFSAVDDPRPVGFVPLWGCDIAETQDADTPLCFEISHPDRRSFFLQAKDETEMNEWANALLTVIDEWKEEQVRKRERFWREHFGTRKEVTWTKFLESLQMETGPLSARQERQLRFMVGTFAAKNQMPDTIKSRQLFLFVELFGSLTTCFNKMGQVCLWYQGSLTSSDATSRLEGLPEGSFLLRLRRFSADSGLLAMSFVEEGVIKHINVFRDPLSECYYLDPAEPVYATVDELIAGHEYLKPLPPPRLGRAYREFKEKSGDVESVEDDEVAEPAAAAEEPLMVDAASDDSEEHGTLNDDTMAELRRQAELEAAAFREADREVEAASMAAIAEESARRAREADELKRAEAQRAAAEAEQREREAEEAAEAKRRELAEAKEKLRLAQEAERRRQEEQEQQRLEAEEEERRRKRERQKREEEARLEAERERQRQEAERLRAQKEAAAREAERLRIEAERAKEQLRLEKEKREREEREERERAERKERERADRERAERERAERERADRERADRERAERERAERERADRERADRERAEHQEREQRDRAERERQTVAARLREAEAAHRAEQEAAARAAEEKAALRAAEEKRIEAERLRAGMLQKTVDPKTDQQKTEQQRRVEAQKAKIEEERRKLEAERQAKLAQQGRGMRGNTNPPAAVAMGRAEPELEDAVDYSNHASLIEASQYPEFSKDTKVERLYKERMLQARAGEDAATATTSPAGVVSATSRKQTSPRKTAAPAAAPAAAATPVATPSATPAAAATTPSAPGTAAPPSKTTLERDTRIIHVDVTKLREIMQYLSDLEDQGELTEDEVYQLERLITVEKDQLVLSYYMTFSEQSSLFVKKCRRHLKNRESK